MSRIIILLGPTGVGKTGASILLGKRLGTEIISADSMQIYKHMDIGTAKPDPEELKMARHHLVSIVDPDEEFDAAAYAGLADKAIDSITQRRKLPVIAGGTGFYIKALLHGLCRGIPADKTVIEQLEAEGRDKGSDYLHDKLVYLVCI